MENNNNCVWWCGINTALIFLLAFYIFVDKGLDNEALTKVEELETKIETIETMKADTFVINVNNHIVTPQPKVVVK